MAEPDDDDGNDDGNDDGGAEQAHGVHGAPREDGGMQEQPPDADELDEQNWADATETGGQASS